MIDPEKVIKGLRCLSDAYDTKNCVKCEYDFASCVLDVSNDALELLKGHEWYMLTEDDDGIIHGLPGDDGQYLMTDGKDIWIDDYVDGVADGIILDSGRDIREIKAWMYIPGLPKTERW